jgi:hypothetical protein
VSGGDLAPVALPPAKERLIPIKSQAGCEHSGEEKILIPLPEIQSLLLGFPTHSLISISTELSRLLKIQIFH